MKTIAQIEKDFKTEFCDIADKFKIFELNVAEARESKEQYVWHPGVYVWWHPSEGKGRGAIKVGRHLTNSRKRALEHIRPDTDTGGILARLGEDSETKLLLFNVRNPDDRHWVAALEIYFENILDPLVHSDRLG